MLVFTNRAIKGDGTSIDDYQDELGFGTSSQFRVLEVSNSLNVELLGTSSNQDFRAAKKAILDFKDELGDDNLVVYIHGYNNTLKSSVERCLKLEKLYGVKTLSMTWPTKLGPLNQSNARESLQNARGSKKAFQAMLAILARTLETSANKVTLAVHSQGCNVYQNVIELGSGGLSHDRFFENIMLLAAHCRLSDHRRWVTKLQPRNKVFITINEGDKVLRGARHIRGMTYKRLGLAKDGLIKDVPKIEYEDFAPHSSIFSEHSYFVNNLNRYEETVPFFEAAFNGRDAGKEVFDPNHRIERSYLWYLKRINGVHFPPSLLSGDR